MAKIYDDNLSSILNLKIPYKVPNCVHVYHLYVIRTNKRDDLKEYLIKNGIQTLIHYPELPINSGAFKNFGYKSESFNNALEWENEEVSIPIGPHLSRNQIYKIIDTINDY